MKNSNLEFLTRNLTARIKTELDNLRVKELNPEGRVYYTSTEMASKLIEKGRVKLGIGDTAQFVQMVSVRMAQMFNTRKIDRTNKRVEGKSYGYFTHTPLGHAATAVEREEIRAIVEEADTVYKNAASTITKLLGFCSDEDLVDIQLSLTTLMVERTQLLRNKNREFLKQVQRYERMFDHALGNNGE